MKWFNLLDYPFDEVYGGSIIRVPTMKPYNGEWYIDPVVDFLVFEAYSLMPNAGLGLMVMSGPKAGKVNVVFPNSSYTPNTRGLNKRWLIDNWKKFFYRDGEPHQAWIGSAGSLSVLPNGDEWDIPDA